MNMSTTVLAIGTSAGLVITSALSGAVVATLSFLAYLHGRRVWNWMKRIRTADDRAKDLEDVDKHLWKLAEVLSALHQKPCRADDFDELLQLRQLTSSFVKQDHLRPELETIVRHCNAYMATSLTSPATGPRIPQLKRAMEQEYERTQLYDAVTAAQQKIRTLRKA